MQILIALAIAVVVGIVAYVLLNMFPPTRPYSSLLSLVIAILVFLVKFGVIN